MKSIDFRKARIQFLRLLAQVEEKGERFIICRDGQPVAALIPHQTKNRTRPHPQLRKIRINYDPVESLSLEEWPSTEN